LGPYTIAKLHLPENVENPGVFLVAAVAVREHQGSLPVPDDLHVIPFHYGHEISGKSQRT
jgi:hypothetical protein